MSNTVPTAYRVHFVPFRQSPGVTGFAAVRIVGSSATHHWTIALNVMDHCNWLVCWTKGIWISFRSIRRCYYLHCSTINAVLHFCWGKCSECSTGLIPGTICSQRAALLLLLVNSYSKSVGPCSSCRLSLFAKVQIFVTKQLFLVWCMWIDWSTYCRNCKSDSNQLVLGVPVDWVSLQEFKYLWYCGSECGACVKLVNFF